MENNRLKQKWKNMLFKLVIAVLTISTWLFIIWGTTYAFIYQNAIEIKKLGLKE